MGVHLDERGIRITGSLRGALEDPLDLRLDGHRVWSFRPGRDGFKLGRSRLVPRPEALLPLLNGRSEVEVVAHDGDRPLFSGAFLFGGSEDPIVLTDDLGAVSLLLARPVLRYAAIVGLLPVQGLAHLCLEVVVRVVVIHAPTLPPRP